MTMEICTQGNEKEAYSYAVQRLNDPCFPQYNWESELMDAHMEGQIYVIGKAVEWLYQHQTVDLEVPNIENFINDLKQHLQGGDD